MRVLITGARDWLDDEAVRVILDGLYVRCVMEEEELTIIEGAAPGADHAAGEWARQAILNHLDVRHEPYPYIGTLGRAGGPVRNQKMIDEGKPEVAFAFHDDLSRSKGTVDMVKKLQKAEIPTFLISRIA